MFKLSLPYKSIVLATLLGLTACASEPQEEGITPTRHFTDPALKAYADNEFAVYDPLFSTNKHIYKFNAEFDKYIALPIVNGYIYVTPEFVRTGVSNFFLNISEVTNFINSALQINPSKAGTALTRFAINSTIGIAGTVDVATRIGLNQKPEDFGKTLAHWGVGPGAYVVIPLLGPSNMRDTVGKIVDYGTLVFIIPEDVQHTIPYDVVAYGLQPVNMRYTNSFRYYSSGSPFEYELVRYITTQTREAQIEKEKKE